MITKLSEIFKLISDNYGEKIQEISVSTVNKELLLGLSFNKDECTMVRIQLNESNSYATKDEIKLYKRDIYTNSFITTNRGRKKHDKVVKKIITDKTDYYCGYWIIDIDEYIRGIIYKALTERIKKFSPVINCSNDDFEFWIDSLQGDFYCLKFLNKYYKEDRKLKRMIA